MKTISSEGIKNDMQNRKELVTIGFYSSIFVAVSTIITFGFAMIAIPPAGPYCPANCMDYPFLNLLKYYPRDYLWMYCSIFQLIGYVVFTVAILFQTNNSKTIFSFLGLCFAVMAVLILMSDYFVQFTVVPISVRNNELEGIPILTQYNGHGIFIALHVNYPIIAQSA